MTSLGQGLGWGLGRGLRRLLDATAPAPSDGHSEKCETLAAAPAALMEMLAEIPADRWRSAPRAGGFSAVEHACHLRDLETEGYRLRLDRILAETEPHLPDLDGDALARERNYLGQDAAAACSAFAAVRAGVVARLTRLTPAERVRRGLLDGRTPFTLDEMVVAMLAHDAAHMQQLSQLRDEMGGRPG